MLLSRSRYNMLRHVGVVVPSSSTRSRHFAWNQHIRKCPDRQMVCECRESVQRQKEQILDDNRRPREEARRCGCGFLDSCPGQVHVEEKEKNPKPDNGPLFC